MNRAIPMAVVVLLVVLVAALIHGARPGTPGPDPEGPRTSEDATRAAELRGRPGPEPTAPPPAEPASSPEGREETPTPDALHGPPIVGVVLDADTGYGVAGATLRLRRGGSTANWSESYLEAPLAQTVSDGSGAFRFDTSPREGLVTLEADAATYVRVARTLTRGKGTAPLRVELRLERAGRLEGEVRRSDGTWAAGATVFVLPADAPELLLADPTGRGFGGGRTWEAHRGEVLADGSYVVEGLSLDASHVAAAIDTDGARSPWAKNIVPTSEALRVWRELHLEAPAVVRARALAPDGTVLRAARMLLHKPSWLQVLESNSEGVHELRGIVPGTYVLRVDAPELLRKETELTLEAGTTRTLDVQLEAGVPLAGVLVDDRGQPIANQTIHVSKPWWRSDELADSSGRDTTDAEGRFRIEGLHPQPHTLGLVLGKHYVPELQLLEAPDENVRFVVLRMASLRARLVLPSGVDAPETLALRIGHTVREGWPEGQTGWTESGHRHVWNGGQLHVPVLPPRACRVRLLVHGCAPVTREITPRPGEVLDLGALRLDRGVELPLRVQDATGAPVAGAATRLLGSMQAASVATDAEGRCVLSTLARGRHELEIEADGFLTRRVEVTVPVAEDLVVRLDRGGAVTCAVLTREGHPAADVTLRWRLAVETDGESSWAYDTTDHRGRLALRLPPGRWVVEAFDDAWTSEIRAEVDVTEGEAVDVKLVVPTR